MHKPNLYRPPPPPPRQQEAVKDPLFALQRASVAKTLLGEELTDLADEDLEQWASGGTRIIPKSEMTPLHATVSSAPLPPVSVTPTIQQSYYPVSLPVPSAAHGKSHAGIIALIAALAVLVMGAALAVLALVVHRAREVDVAAIAPPVETSAPVEVATSGTTSTSTMRVSAAPSTTSTSTNAASTSTRPPVRASTASTIATSTIATSTGTGSLRTFAAGNGKPVYVDNRQIGWGGTKLVAACGKHNVAVGIGKAKSVDIPCNGATITVGSPDGS